MFVSNHKKNDHVYMLCRSTSNSAFFVNNHQLCLESRDSPTEINYGGNNKWKRNWNFLSNNRNRSFSASASRNNHYCCYCVTHTATYAAGPRQQLYTLTCFNLCRSLHCSSARWATKGNALNMNSVTNILCCVMLKTQHFIINSPAETYSTEATLTLPADITELVARLT